MYGYFGLLTDTYPAFDGDYPIRLEIDYPEKPSRWKVLIWKAITSVPHVVVLVFLGIGAFLAVIAAWFAILTTGHFPRDCMATSSVWRAGRCECRLTSSR